MSGSPDPQTRERREVFSAYQAVVKESTKLQQQLKSMLNEHCLRLEGGFRLCHPSAIKRLLARREWSAAQAMLLSQLHAGLIEARKRRQQLRHYMAQEILAEPELLRLTRLCGISLVTLYGLISSIGDVTRFSHARKLSAYFGLNPSVCQSGHYEGSGALKRHGRGAMRALLVQSAKKLLQVQNPLQKWGLAVAAKRQPPPHPAAARRATRKRFNAPPSGPSRHRRHDIRSMRAGEPSDPNPTAARARRDQGRTDGRMETR